MLDDDLAKITMDTAASEASVRIMCSRGDVAMSLPRVSGLIFMEAEEREESEVTFRCCA